MNPISREILSDPEFRRVVGYQVRKYRTGQLIVEEGDPCAELFVVLEGAAAVYSAVEHQGRPGHWSELANFSAGDVIGELSLFDQQPRNASVAAASDCEVAVMDIRSLANYMDDNPGSGYWILKNLSLQAFERLRRTNQRYKALVALSPEGLAD